MARSLYTSAHASNISSVIVRGWKLSPDYQEDLSTFLQQLQDLSSLRHLVLTLPCTGLTSSAALGKLTQLRSLNVCYEVSRSSEALAGSWLNFTQGCWEEAIEPLTALTSLQLKLPLLLQPGEVLNLQAHPELRRLEVKLERLVPPVLVQVRIIYKTHNVSAGLAAH